MVLWKKIYEPLAVLIKKKRREDKLPVSEIKEISLQIHQAFKKIIKEYYEKYFANKFSNWDEMGKFFEKHKL